MNRNVADFDYIFISLSETWLTDSIFSNELGLFNYKVFRCDRSSVTSVHNRGGGVLIAVRNDVSSQYLNITVCDFEQLFVKISYNALTYILCTVYFPPKSSVDSYKFFISNLENLVMTYPDCSFIVSGDFNLPGIDWSNDANGVTYSTSFSCNGRCIPESFAYLNFFQLNEVKNYYGSVLDLIFSSKYNMIIKRSDEYVVPEDRYHPTLVFETVLAPVTNTSELNHLYFDFNRADYVKIEQFLLSYNWNDTINSLNVNEATNALYDALHYCIIRFVPQVKFKKSKFPPWFSSDLKSLTIQKRKAHAAYRASMAPLDYSTFSLLRARYKFFSKKCYDSYIKRVETSFCTNPKSFWGFVRKNKKVSNMPSTVNLNGISSVDRTSMCELFSKHFSSVFSPVDINVDISSSGGLPYELPSSCNICLSDVESGLAKLRLTKSVGPDGLSGSFIYNLRSVLCFPLFLIYSKSLFEGVFPDIWKISSVTPIFKSGDITEVINYRPISIISHLAKLLESFVLQSIYRPINSIIIDEQHGFRPGRSVTTCNLIFTEYVFEAFSLHSQVDSIYLDFTKAFDRVNHRALLKVLLNLGFGEPLLSWFRSYLSERKQLVKINGICSSPVNVTSGVPQGGHLSPVLFALFINGIKDVVKYCELLIFADDIKLFLRINSTDDCELLQYDLNSVARWARGLGLELSIPKCHTMTYTRSCEYITFKYSVNDFALKYSGDCVMDLGISFDRSLTFQTHIEKVTCKALKLLGFIKRISADFKLSSSLKTLYCSFVRSVLEYGLVIWDPCTLDGSCQLERVQRKFLKFATFALHIECAPHEYEPVLQRLCLSTLCDRRKQGNLAFLSKLLNGEVDAPVLLSKVNFRVPTFYSRFSVPFRVPFSRSNYLSNCPTVRMMKLANEDPLFLSS